MLRLVGLALIVVLAACGSSEDRATGVVIDIQGDLSALNSFTLVTPDGERFVFEPDPGATFHGGPLTHLTDHLRSGAPVTVDYRDAGDRLVALEVGDG